MVIQLTILAGNKTMKQRDRYLKKKYKLAQRLPEERRANRLKRIDQCTRVLTRIEMQEMKHYFSTRISKTSEEL